LIILFNIIRTGLYRLIYPNGIHAVRYGRMTVDVELPARVFLFFITYVMRSPPPAAILLGLRATTC
jgi:trk system potassium uptake protein TrkH